MSGILQAAKVLRWRSCRWWTRIRSRANAVAAWTVNKRDVPFPQLPPRRDPSLKYRPQFREAVDQRDISVSDLCALSVISNGAGI